MRLRKRMAALETASHHHGPTQDAWADIQRQERDAPPVPLHQCQVARAFKDGEEVGFEAWCHTCGFTTIVVPTERSETKAQRGAKYEIAFRLGMDHFRACQ